MIAIVPDANTILSGMISPNGATRKIIDLALAKKVVLYGSETTYKEFCEKIQIDRFQKYIKRQYSSFEKIIYDYRSFINVVDTFDILANTTVITTDPDDDEYLKVAIASNSKIIISRDHDLLDLKNYADTVIVSPEKFLSTRYKLNNGKLF